jgi:16S rRNA (guanine1207-N2)-methyltransferase
VRLHQPDNPTRYGIYYVVHCIAHHFLTAAHHALRPGGTLLVVTKFPDWRREHMPEWFDDVTMTERRGYCIFRGVRRAEYAQR